MSEVDTIAALATAPAPAGIAVIRVSGPDARRAISAIFHSSRSPIEHPRELILGTIFDPEGKQSLDQGLAVFMPGPASYTGEDVVEFQMHGSLLLVRRVLRALYGTGVIPAEPGEFTKRAFLNGKLDLVQSEAIGDLISSTSEVALKIATEQMHGRLSTAIEEIGDPLRDALAEIEAWIDFPEEDISPDSLNEILLKIQNCRRSIEKLISSYSYGQIIKDGFRVLLCGAPNAGKSSLMNAFLGTERAIVTEIAGTTRDLIEEEAIFGGYRFIFCDSAGITESSDTVEKIGVELAIERLSWADLVLLVVDGTEAGRAKSRGGWEKVLEIIRSRSSRTWLVVNKIDIAPQAIGSFVVDSRIVERTFYLSAKSEEGLQFLTEALVDEVGGRLADTSQSGVVVTSERHRHGLIRANDALERAERALDTKMPLEFVSAEVRGALTALAEIVGKTWTEDILGRIFAKFCIGK